MACLTVGNLKIARSERSYYCYIHMPTFCIVLLLRITLVWMANCVCVMTKLLRLSSPSLAIAGEHRKRPNTRAHKQEVVSDWLNPHSLGTMSALWCIENLAKNSTCLINWPDITRSI